MLLCQTKCLRVVIIKNGSDFKWQIVIPHPVPELPSRYVPTGVPARLRSNESSLRSLKTEICAVVLDLMEPSDVDEAEGFASVLQARVLARLEPYLITCATTINQLASLSHRAKVQHLASCTSNTPPRFPFFFLPMIVRLPMHLETKPFTLVEIIVCNG